MAPPEPHPRDHDPCTPGPPRPGVVETAHKTPPRALSNRRSGRKRGRAWIFLWLGAITSALLVVLIILSICWRPLEVSIGEQLWTAEGGMLPKGETDPESQGFSHIRFAAGMDGKSIRDAWFLELGGFRYRVTWDH